MEKVECTPYPYLDPRQRKETLTAKMVKKPEVTKTKQVL